MEGMKYIATIRLENILSFGPDTPELPLEPLNVLIGPNASGKSNLIEVLAFLEAAPGTSKSPSAKGAVFAIGSGRVLPRLPMRP